MLSHPLRKASSAGAAAVSVALSPENQPGANLPQHFPSSKSCCLNPSPVVLRQDLPELCLLSILLPLCPALDLSHDS